MVSALLVFFFYPQWQSVITSCVNLCDHFTICRYSSFVTRCKISMVSCFPIRLFPSPVSISWLLKQGICCDQFVFLCKVSYATSSFISLTYSKCSHALEVFFCFSSNICIEICCDDFIFRVTLSHCSFNVIKLFYFFILSTRCWCIGIYHCNWIFSPVSLLPF